MGIPILSDIFGLVGGIVDKIFPDKDVKIKAEMQGKVIELTREQLKADLKLQLMEAALSENKLLMQDMDSARKMYMEEVKEADVPKVAKLFRSMARPFIGFLIVGMWAYNKLIPVINQEAGAEISLISWGHWDNIALISIVGFYFGVRTLEKIKGRD